MAKHYFAMRIKGSKKAKVGFQFQYTLPLLKNENILGTTYREFRGLTNSADISQRGKECNISSKTCSGLEHFIRMKSGDIVLIWHPTESKFAIYEIDKPLILAQSGELEAKKITDRSGKEVALFNDTELTYFHEVKQLTPWLIRKDKLKGKLLGKQYIPVTSTSLDDVAEDIEKIISTASHDTVYEQARKHLIEALSADIAKMSHLEFTKLIGTYFMKKMASTVKVMVKEKPVQTGDTYLVAYFDDWKLAIYAQATGLTDLTELEAIDQLAAVIESSEDDEELFGSSIFWLVSSAPAFSDDARMLAEKKGIVLFTSREFAELLLSVGLESLEVE